MAILSHNPYGSHIINTLRSGRPSSRFAFLKNIKPKHDENCFFCSKTFPQEQLISRWPEKGEWETVRLRNIFPIIGSHNSSVSDTHELIVPSPLHSITFGKLSLKSTIQYFEMMSQAVGAISKKKNVIYTSVFTNEGPGAGASQPHLHTQLLGIDLLPPRISDLSGLCQNRCYFCDFFSSNMGEVIAEQGNFIAVVPKDAQVYYQIKIIGPHAKGIQFLNPSQLEDLSKIFLSCQKALEACIDRPSMNILYRTGAGSLDFHFHIDIYPRLTLLGGFEYDTGIMALSSHPADWAQDLKSKIQNQA